MNAKRSTVPAVDVINMDDMALMSDVELHGLASRLYARVERGYDRDVEVELAYIQRELKIRNVRFEKHREYMATLSDGSTVASTQPTAL